MFSDIYVTLNHGEYLDNGEHRFQSQLICSLPNKLPLADLNNLLRIFAETVLEIFGDDSNEYEIIWYAVPFEGTAFASYDMSEEE